MAVVYDPPTRLPIRLLPPHTKWQYGSEALADTFPPSGWQNASSIIIFNVYHKTCITPAVVNILMNYSHSGGLRIFRYDNAEWAMAVLHDCGCRYIYSPRIRYGGQPVADTFPPSGWYCIVQGCSTSAELLVRIKYMTLFVSGKRRYDRKQCGYGGQTKPIFHKKVCDVDNVSSAYIILIT